MLVVHPLYSSSSGNMFHIATNNTNILIDVGVSYKAINDGLKSIGLDIKDIDAVLITHEHIDHIKGLPLLCRKNDIPVYACLETAGYIQEELSAKNIKGNLHAIEYDKPFLIKDLEICAFETSHDAVMPCGYKITDLTDEKTITFATDLGFVSPNVLDNFKVADYAILESNYDDTMLQFGKYPYPLKQRIRGIKGHLSNDACGETLATLAKEGHNRFLIAHMSENNNNIEIAKQTLESTLLQNGINLDNIELSFASKTLSSEEYTIC